MRVQIPAYTDRWMMGDRYGEVTKVVRQRTNVGDRKGDEVAHIKLDKSGKIFTAYLDDCQVI